ncbi:desmoglein-2.1-like [Lepisosteus oculatus]|uniref:desmoglein-2.1-like n=1 Tax=Lepisosteus oculatus TaxID=7918 RepID=UPI003717BD6C
MARVPQAGIGLLLLVMFLVFKNPVESKEEVQLQRRKREWIIPPVKIPENEDYTKREYIAKIRSDHETPTRRVTYEIKGKGADQEPFNVFIVDRNNGNIRVTAILDREQIAVYNLTGIAKDMSGNEVEKDIELRISVEDKNDCPPVFKMNQIGEIYELSPKGASVMQVIATDNDDPATINVVIKYSILSQSPPDQQMFEINETTGMIYVKKPTLDREVQDSYTLIVQGTDMNGAINGNAGTGSVEIKILDVNDNVPTLEKEEYVGSVEENTENVEIMRIKALDKDLEFTENWEAVFDIVSGNEGGYFSIVTNSKTNEGILMLHKALDYEEMQNLELGVAVRNKAAFYGSAASAFSSSMKTYPIKIQVKNQPEGPRFNPKVKAISISEESKKVMINTVIAKYPAVDGDTGKPAEKVRYAKGLDPDNWLTIDEKTAEIKLNKLPDRESKYLTNGTYYAKILVMTEDMPSKTATGTIALQVEDSNDHCPVLTSTSQVLCTESRAVFVTAEDGDADPNGPPFEFEIIPEGTKGTWRAEKLNDTTAILRAQDNLWPGSYEVAVEVKDQQGLSCPDKQVVKVDVCTCDKEQTACVSARKTTGAELGAAGFGLLILGFLMMLLVPLLLLFCSCGGLGVGGKGGAFLDMPFDTKEHLIAYHTEGQGEDKAVPLLTAPVQIKTGGYQVGSGLMTAGAGAMTGAGAGAMAMTGAGAGGMAMAGAGAAISAKEYIMAVNNAQESRYGFYARGGSRYEGDMMYRGSSHAFASGFESRESAYDSMALPEGYLEDYYMKKVMYMAEEDQIQKDGLLIYDFEGRESPVGSVGCCSFIEGDDDLEFLNDLGPKFKTLAEICTGDKMKSEVLVTPPMPTVQDVAVTRTEIKRENTVTTDAVRPQPSPVPQPQIQKNVVTEQYSSTTLPAMHLRENVVVPSPAYVIQQPVYYTTTPVVQPTRYIVEPQVHNTMLFSERPAAPNVQGVLLLNEGSGSEKVLFQEKRVVSGSAVQGGALGVLHGTLNRSEIPGSQNVVLVETRAGSGQFVQEGIAGSNQGAVHRVGLPGSQNVVLVERKAGSGQFVQEGVAGLNQGAVHRVGLPGSQNVVFVERKAESGQLMQDGMVGFSQGTAHRGGLSGAQSMMIKEKTVLSSAGSQDGMMGLNGRSVQLGDVTGSQKVYVKEKIVSCESVQGTSSG